MPAQRPWDLCISSVLSASSAVNRSATSREKLGCYHRGLSMRHLLLALTLFAAPLFAQHDMSDMPGMNSSDQSEPKHTGTADDAMSHMHMDGGPHMKMTMLREPRPGDEARADDIVKQLRSAIEKYQD